MCVHVHVCVWYCGLIIDSTIQCIIKDHSIVSDWFGKRNKRISSDVIWSGRSLQLYQKCSSSTTLGESMIPLFQYTVLYNWSLWILACTLYIYRWSFQRGLGACTILGNTCTCTCTWHKKWKTYWFTLKLVFKQVSLLLYNCNNMYSVYYLVFICTCTCAILTCTCTCISFSLSLSFFFS